MSCTVFQEKVDKYLHVLDSETMRALEDMENDIHQLGKLQRAFKRDFLKNSYYQYVFEMKINSNHTAFQHGTHNFSN